MMLMAEVLGYDTAMMEGFEQQGVCETLRLPMSYWVVSLLTVGHLERRGQVRWRTLRSVAYGLQRRVWKAVEVGL